MADPEITGSRAAGVAREIARARSGAVSIAFTGRGEPAATEALVSRLAPPGTATAWARQIHSATVLTARPGLCGEGDALVTDDNDLALCVVTADCVPLLMSDGRRIAAVHAGWRGIVAGVVGAAASRFLAPATVTAWIGPAIGPCCYEIGDDVARSIAAVAGDGVLRPGAGDLPHADLPLAVERQLAAAGVETAETWRHCTRCGDGRWSSYRRDGATASRNHALIWKHESY
ncbi:MAG: polyphenol oxidase family protein [Thermoanaerobaculia bacterium]